MWIVGFVSFDFVKLLSREAARVRSFELLTHVLIDIKDCLANPLLHIMRTCVPVFSERFVQPRVGIC